MASITVTVPLLPPSLNNLYSTNRQGRRFKVKAAKPFLQYLALELRGRRLSGSAFSLSILFTFPNRRRTDLSNRIKSLEDDLVELGVIPDDSMITELQARKVIGTHAQTGITIAELESTEDNPKPTHYESALDTMRFWTKR